MKKKINLSTILSLSFFIFCVLLSIVLAYCTATKILDADASSEMVLANLLSNKNQILTSSWAYSSELRVLNNQLIFSPLFKIISNWGTVRLVGTIILHIILIASYYFFCHQAKISTKNFLISAGLLLIPFSVTYARIILVHSYYIPHVAIGFTILGLIFALNNNDKKKIKSFYFAVFWILSFLSGLGGVRQFLVTFVPLVITYFILIFPSNDFKFFVQEFGQKQKSKPESIKILFSSSVLKNFINICSGFIFAFAGYLINTNIFTKMYLFDSQTNYSLGLPELGQVKSLGRAFLEIFGYQRWMPMQSIEGIVSILSMIGIGCLGGIIIYLLCRIKKLKYSSYKVVLVFFVVTMIVNTLTFSITRTILPHYYIPVVIYLFPIMAIGLEQIEIPFPKIRKGVIYFVITALVANSLVVFNYFVNRPSDSTLNYSGLLYHNIDIVPQVKPALTFLQENDYQFGYATYWNTNILTELSNGDIEVAGIKSFYEGFYTTTGLTVLDYTKEGYHVGKTFVLLDLDEEIICKEGGFKWFDALELVYRDDFFAVYHSPSVLT